MLTPEEVQYLPADPVEAMLQVAEKVVAEVKAYRIQLDQRNNDKDRFAKIIVARSLVIILAENLDSLLPEANQRYVRYIPAELPDDTDNSLGLLGNALNNIITSCKALRESRRIERLAADSLAGYRHILASAREYRISDDVYANIQNNINALRDLIRTTPDIPDEQKRRLLAKLELFQSELNKKMSHLTVALGAMTEFANAIAVFGEKVKPATDRVCEIFRSMQLVQTQAESLPLGHMDVAALIKGAGLALPDKS